MERAIEWSGAGKTQDGERKQHKEENRRSERKCEGKKKIRWRNRRLERRLAIRCGPGVRARAPCRLAFTEYKKKCVAGRVARKKEGYEKTGRLLGLNEKRRRSGCTGTLRYLCSLPVIRKVVPL